MLFAILHRAVLSVRSVEQASAGRAEVLVLSDVLITHVDAGQYVLDE